MSTSAHDELYPRGEGPFRYRIYRLRGGKLDVVSATASAQGIGLAIVAGHEEGEFEGDDRVGVLDTVDKGDGKGTWIVSPFTGGRGRRDLAVGDHVESAVTGWGQPYISGIVTDISRDVATVLLDKPKKQRLTSKRSLKNLRVVADDS